jgi:hypothetical protein
LVSSGKVASSGCQSNREHISVVPDLSGPAMKHAFWSKDEGVSMVFLAIRAYAFFTKQALRPTAIPSTLQEIS